MTLPKADIFYISHNVKPPTILGTLSIDDDEMHRERTGSRTSFTAGKFESCCEGRVSHVKKGNANEVFKMSFHGLP